MGASGGKFWGQVTIPANHLPPMPLSDIALRTAKPTDKPYKLTDGGGLYVEVYPTGGKLWRLKYRFGGKEKRLSLGA